MKLFDFVLEQRTEHNDSPVRDLLRQRYSEPHRHYHDWQHILEGIALFETLARVDNEFNLTPVQQAAWLFHDVVYDIGSTTNEQDSAALAVNVLGNTDEPLFQFSTRELHEIAQIILATDYATAQDWLASANPIRDVDLAGFRSLELMRRNDLRLAKEFDVALESVLINSAGFFKTVNLEYSTELARSNWGKDAAANRQHYIDMYGQ